MLTLLNRVINELVSTLEDRSNVGILAFLATVKVRVELKAMPLKLIFSMFRLSVNQEQDLVVLINRLYLLRS